MQNIENCRRLLKMSSLLAWPNVRLNQVVVQKKNILSQKGFPKQLTLPSHTKNENGEKKKVI